jgi:hypothetical protein
MSEATDAARRGVEAVGKALGLTIPEAAVEPLAEAVVGLVNVLGSAAQKRAKAAGEAAAAAITTADEAEQAARDRK